MPPKYVESLRMLVERGAPALLELSDVQSARRPDPSKWSPREVIGHLIDSASNNHQRFVRGQLTEDLVFPGYEQDAWVRVQRYQDVPWKDLVTLWQAFNLHLVHVMTVAPESVRLRPRERHNLDEIATPRPSKTEPATLDYFMSDYVDHLLHHLKQILGAEWNAE